MARLFILSAGIALSALFLAGCTDLERRGYSPIPQNSPGSWSYRPYGDMQN